MMIYESRLYILFQNLSDKDQISNLFEHVTSSSSSSKQVPLKGFGYMVNIELEMKHVKSLDLDPCMANPS